MSRDNKSKLSKKEQNKRSKKNDDSSQKKKKNIESDSDSFIESESETDEMDQHEYRKFLKKIFPSKHIENKIKAGEKLKNKLSAKEDSSDSEQDEKVNKKVKNKKGKKIMEDSESEEAWETASEETEEDEKVSKKQKYKKSKKNQETESDSDSEDNHDDESSCDEEEGKKTRGKNKKINIIFTIGGAEEEDEEEWDSEEYDSDYDDYEDSECTEDEDEPVSSDSEKDDDREDNDSEDKKKKTKKNISKKEKEVVNVTNGPSNDAKSDILKETHPDLELLTELKEKYEKNKDNKSLKKCIDVLQENIKQSNAKKEKKEKKHKAKNLRIFRKIIRDKNTMNDFAFYEKLDLDYQKKIIKELREINKITRIEKPYRMTLLESEIPTNFKAAAMKKINSLKYMEPGSGEFYKIKNWVDTFMRMPFGKYETLPLTIEDGVNKCHDFMSNAQQTLDKAVYGLNDAKMQIMQMLGQLITNPSAIGTAIAIHGPPGTGKTSLVKEGISKILNRPFAFIALGGATDSSFLEGHSYTYEGSTWGKIVQILIDSKCMNPVIYFDELDKISETPRGEEIAGILTHLTDTSQNSQFHDKYFAEINFDLSKCLFIFSYNDETKVNPILKDRMYRIQTKGYNLKQKIVIGNNYLLPKIREQVKFNEGDIIIPDETISYIIDNHCNKEDGVRNLKRCIEIIYTKINLYRLMRPGSNLFEEEMSIVVEFPFKVTKDVVDKLIKSNKDPFSSALYSMYV